LERVEEIRTSWKEFITNDRYKEHFTSNEEEWYFNLNKVKEYMNREEKRPSQHDKDNEIKKLGAWISNNTTNYKKKERIMKNEEIRTSWEEFTTDDRYYNYFISNEEEWYLNLNKVKEYMDREEKRPSKEDKDNEIKKLGTWIGTNIKNYKKKQNNMKNEEIRMSWEEFISDILYKNYFISNEEEWYLNLNKVKEYMDRENKRPSSEDKDNEIKKLGKWIGTNTTNYKKKQNNMKNEEIRTSWEEFTTDDRYYNYFTSNEEEWYFNLNKVKEYIDRENKRPYSEDKDNEIKKLGAWINNNTQNYKKKENIMKNEEIRTSWKEFITNDRYNKYFFSNEDIWYGKLQEVKEYIYINNKKPSKESTDENEKVLGTWIGTNLANCKKNQYIMKNEEIRKAWEDFIESYPNLFNSS